MPNQADAVKTAGRTLRFAIIGVLPRESLVRASVEALDNASAFEGEPMSGARQVLGDLARGILPSQPACISAWKEVMRAELIHAERQGQAESAPAMRVG